MFFEIVLVSLIVIGIAIRVVRIIVWVMVFIGRFFGSAIWEIAKAVPVLDFCRRESVVNDIVITNVFIEPSRIRNWDVEVFLRSFDAMIAAWELPSPGSREQIGEIRIVARVGFMMWDFFIFGSVVFCCGIFVGFWIEWIIVEVAKSPVRSGVSGFLIWRFRVARPRREARVKISRDFSFLFSFSVIRKILVQIKMKDIICFRVG